MTTTSVEGPDDADATPQPEPTAARAWDEGLPSFLIHGRGLGVRCA